MKSLLLLLFLLLPSPVSSSVCPCDLTPSRCDLHCCCDPSCSTDQLLTFSCVAFLLGSPRLCCRDALAWDGEGYASTRTCSNSLGCLEEIPGGYGEYSQQEVKQVEVGRMEMVEGWTSYNSVGEQYRDTDDLLREARLPFLFPVQLHGELCIPSPLSFYSDQISTCTKPTTQADCVAGSHLDHTRYLTELLLYPGSDTLLDLRTNVTLYCASEGVQEECTAGTRSPTLQGTSCNNVVQKLHIRLKVAANRMVLEEVHVTATLVSVTLPSSVHQTFSLTYEKQASSGNFGYLPGSSLLSGVVEEGTVVVPADPSLRPLAFFDSADCGKVTRLPFKFGVGQYAGCLLKIPSFNAVNLGSLSDSAKEEYCKQLKDVVSGIFPSSISGVVGRTGVSDPADLAQWVAVEEDVEARSGTEGVGCSDVTSHVTYKVTYSHVGREDNLQAVVTRVQAVHTKQEVTLYCGSSDCVSAKSLLLSSSVEWAYSPPVPVPKYKVQPRTTLILPLDFFYPLTNGAARVVSVPLLVALLLY